MVCDNGDSRKPCQHATWSASATAGRVCHGGRQGIHQSLDYGAVHQGEEAPKGGRLHLRRQGLNARAEFAAGLLSAGHSHTRQACWGVLLAALSPRWPLPRPAEHNLATLSALAKALPAHMMATQQQIQRPESQAKRRTDAPGLPRHRHRPLPGTRQNSTEAFSATICSLRACRRSSCLSYRLGPAKPLQWRQPEEHPAKPQHTERPISQPQTPSQEAAKHIRSPNGHQNRRSMPAAQKSQA